MGERFCQVTEGHGAWVRGSARWRGVEEHG